MTLKDFLGVEFGVDDTVVYIGGGRYGYLRRGVVADIYEVDLGYGDRTKVKVKIFPDNGGQQSILSDVDKIMKVET